jgi:prepilin-type N-terminal cleavage/methylation domain-containing protein
MTHRPGFTFGELVAVIAVMAIMATIAAPSFKYLVAKYTLNGAANLLSADLRYTQQRSVTEQKLYELRIVPATRSYSVVNLVASSTIKAVTLDPAITISSPTGLASNRVNFNASGAPSSNGDVILSHASGYTSTVSVRPSGFVTVQ